MASALNSAGASPQTETIEPTFRTTDAASTQAVDIASAFTSENAIENPNDESVFPGKGQIVQYIRLRYQEWKNHKDYMRYSTRLVDCLRAYKGEYATDKLAAIKTQGGSDVYARLTSVKCRAVTATLADIFTGSERPWQLDPSPSPAVPIELDGEIIKMVSAEAQQAKMMGQEMPAEEVAARVADVFEQAADAAKRNAKTAAQKATTEIDDMLHEGGFYKALQDFITDLPIFPMAIIKGPVFGSVKRASWTDKGKIEHKEQVILKWKRISPFDFMFDPGANNVDEGDVLERVRYRRTDLVKLKRTPGVDVDAIDQVLSDYDLGHRDWLDESDTLQAYDEGREDPVTNRSNTIMGLEFHGWLRGEWLLDFGFTEKQVEDKNGEYAVTAWVVGEHLIKLILNPSEDARHPYWTSCFEPVPGSVPGVSLTEVVSDAQDVANACLRALVNNMSISSGPMAYVNEDRLSATTDADDMHPWKVWRFHSDPNGNTDQPITFFSPASNATELLQVYNAMQALADETSAIPRYMSGGNPTQGAAGTASGLSQLMGNANKVLQNIARNLDTEILDPMLKRMYALLLSTDVGVSLRGDENVRVRGATSAMSRDQERMRQLEMLQITANPIDSQIVGLDGRAALLRSVSSNIGMEHENVVPSEDEMKKKQEESQKQQKQQQDAQMQAMMQDKAAKAQGQQAAMEKNMGDRGGATEATSGPSGPRSMAAMTPMASKAS